MPRVSLLITLVVVLLWPQNVFRNNPPNREESRMTPEEIQVKTGKLMYALTKHAARNSFVEFLEEWNLTIDEYHEIRDNMMEVLKISRPYV